MRVLEIRQVISRQNLVKVRTEEVFKITAIVSWVCQDKHANAFQNLKSGKFNSFHD